MNCLNCHYGHVYDNGCLAGVQEQPLAPWERELLGQTMHSDITLTLKGGDTLEFADVDVDSVSPNGTAADVIAIEFVNQDRVVHVPNVLYWEFTHTYR